MDYSTEYKQIEEMLEEARLLVEKKQGNTGSYAWLTGALKVGATFEHAERILRVAKENYGEKNEEATNA